MAVNMDLGFLLSVISFFTIHDNQYHLVVCAVVPVNVDT